jgi:WD40 repeat protein
MLVWLPEKSRIRKKFDEVVRSVNWRVTCGMIQSWSLCEATLKEHSQWVNSVAFSQDGRRVVSGSNDKTVRIWNVETGEEEKKLEGNSGYVYSVAFSQNGRRVVSGSLDKTVRVWNVEAGEEERKLKGHSDTVYSVAFSQDGRRVVSGSKDNTVRNWNVETEEEERNLGGNLYEVYSVAFLQDGRRVISKYGDIAKISNVETGMDEPLDSLQEQTKSTQGLSLPSDLITLNHNWIYSSLTDSWSWLPPHNLLTMKSNSCALCLGLHNGGIIILKTQ